MDYTIGLLKAYETALESNHETTRVGAAIFDEYVGQWYVGYNRRLSSVKDGCSHAEVESIFKAVRNMQHSDKLTMYAPWASCLPCAKDIVASGIIRRVVRHLPLMRLTPDAWRQQVTDGETTLRVNGIEVIDYQGPIHLAKPILFNGRWFNGVSCR